MAWQAVTDVNDGQSLDGAAWETVKDAIEQLQTAIGPDESTPLRAMCQVSRSVGNGVADSTSTAINWTTIDLDPLTWSATGTRVTPTLAGWYRVSYELRWSADTDYTNVQSHVEINGSGVHGAQRFNPGSTTPWVTGVTKLFELNGSTDYVELKANQTNTSGATNTVTGAMLVELVYKT